jgi:DNA-binding PadR family transcriptional regulator
MKNQSDDLSGLLPLREPTFFILLSLSDGQKHGYAILKDVAELSQGKVTLGTGTLYEALARLLDQGLIERVALAGEADGAAHPGRPRKAYRLTPRGGQAVQAEAARLDALAAAARGRLAL